MEDLMSFADILSQEESLQPLVSIIETVMKLSDADLNETTVESMIGAFTGAFTESVKSQTIDAIANIFKEEEYSRKQATELTNTMIDGLSAYVESLKPSPEKNKILANIIYVFRDLFNAAVARRFTADIILPMILMDGAQAPTYAHETDACADIYAIEDALVPAHSISNKIRTGLKIALPQGWQARIAPRSSIGAKTPLRMSNAQGIIDTLYHDEIYIFYDNISDSDYQIHKGDRIAQMWVEPIHTFEAQPVDILPIEDDRGGGVGSTGV